MSFEGGFEFFDGSQVFNPNNLSEKEWGMGDLEERGRLKKSQEPVNVWLYRAKGILQMQIN